MATQIGQEITPLPAAPVEGAGFRVRAAAFLSALVTLALELVTWTTQVNAVAVAVNADAVAAASAAGEAGTAAGVADAASGAAATAASEALAAAAEAAQWAAGAAPMLSGAGAPAAETGADGQYYLDTVSGDLSKRTAGAWSVVASLMGPSGSGVPAGGTSGQTLVKMSDADGDTGWGASGLSITRVTGSAALVANTVHRCYLTADATFALPASPADGDYLEVWDGGRTFDAHAVVVSGTVRGDAEGMTLDMAGSRTAFVYDATTATWQDSSVLGA